MLLEETLGDSSERRGRPTPAAKRLRVDAVEDGGAQTDGLLASLRICGSVDLDALDVPTAPRTKAIAPGTVAGRRQAKLKAGDPRVLVRDPFGLVFRASTAFAVEGKGGMLSSGSPGVTRGHKSASLGVA